MSVFCGKSLKLGFCLRVRLPIPSDVSLKKPAVPSPVWSGKAHVLLLVKRFTKHGLDVLGRATLDPVQVDRHQWQAPQCLTAFNRLKRVAKDFLDARKRARVGCADANLRGSVLEHLLDLNARKPTDLRGRGFERVKGWIAPTIQMVSSKLLSTNRDEYAQVTETGTPARSRVPQIAWSNILVKSQGKCRARHRRRFTFRKWSAYIG